MELLGLGNGWRFDTSHASAGREDLLQEFEGFVHARGKRNEFTVLWLADVVVKLGNQNFDTPSTMRLNNVLFGEVVNDSEAPFFLDVFCQCPEALTDSSKPLIYLRDNLAHTVTSALGVSIRWRSA